MSRATQIVEQAIPIDTPDEPVGWAPPTKTLDSEEAGLASIPADWTIARLDALARLVSGGTPSKKRPDWWRGPIPWASPKDMKRSKLRDTQDHISEAAVENGSRLVPAGTIFVVIRGMILAKDVPVAMAEVPMAFNQDMKAVLPGGQVDAEYLLYALASRKRALAREISTSAHGTRRMGTASLESLLMPVPPLPEQRAIAAVLAKIGAAVEVQDKIVATLKELKAATMAKLFREGLRREPTERRDTRFGEVPMHWVEALLAECAVVQTGVAKGRGLDGSRVVEAPYLRVANVQDGYLALDEIKTIEIRESELRRYSLQPDDVLLTEGGDFDKLGRGFIWHGQIPGCVHQNHIFAVRTDRSKLLPEFFAYLAQSPYGKAYFLSVAHKTTNLACINASKLKAFPLLLAGLEEQRAIATALLNIDKSVDAATRNLTAFRGLFSSMLHLLTTGRVRVNRIISEA